jgi:hypothetical protein
MAQHGFADVRQLPGARGLRRAGALLLTVLTAVACLLPAAASASATTYRYWSYWHVSDGRWAFATTGPGGYRPPDGAVEGWRFAVSSQGGGAAPRDLPAFTDVCGSQPRKDGEKRVVLVVDEGTPADAPPGETVPDPLQEYCVTVPESASGAQVLTAVVKVRSNDSGLVCGIDGWPSRGCGEVVTAPATTAPSPTRSAAPSTAPTSAAGPTAGSSTKGSSKSSSSSAAAAATASTSSPAAATATARGSGAAPTPSTSASAAATAAGDGTPTPTVVLGGTEPASSSRGVPVGLIVGLVLVGLLGSAAALRARRARGDRG